MKARNETDEEGCLITGPIANALGQPQDVVGVRLPRTDFFTAPASDRRAFTRLFGTSGGRAPMLHADVHSDRIGGQ